MRLVTGDTVIIRAGKDRGKRGPILAVIPKDNRVVVEGISLIKKHTKPSKKLPHGGIIQREASISAANVQLICSECSKPTKVKRQVTEQGTVRICAQCDAAVPSRKTR